MVAISTRNTMRKFANFVRLYTSQHFLTEFGNFTTFKRFFRELRFYVSFFPHEEGTHVINVCKDGISVEDIFYTVKGSSYTVDVYLQNFVM